MNETNLRRILIEGFGDTAAARKQLILRFSFRPPICIHIPVRSTLLSSNLTPITHIFVGKLSVL